MEIDAVREIDIAHVKSIGVTHGAHYILQKIYEHKELPFSRSLESVKARVKRMKSACKVR